MTTHCIATALGSSHGCWAQIVEVWDLLAVSLGLFLLHSSVGTGHVPPSSRSQGPNGLEGDPHMTKVPWVLRGPSHQEVACRCVDTQHGKSPGLLKYKPVKVSRATTDRLFPEGSTRHGQGQAGGYSGAHDTSQQGPIVIFCLDKFLTWSPQCPAEATSWGCWD